jgi:hypothetical protein
MQFVIREISREDVDRRLASFEEKFGMSSADFYLRYCDSETVPGIHPHIAALWAGDIEEREMIASGESDIDQIELLLSATG